MKTVDDLVRTVEAIKPATVSMTHSTVPMLDGLSFFFVGPGGRSAAPLFGITDKLETDNIAPLVEVALKAAIEVA